MPIFTFIGDFCARFSPGKYQNDILFLRAKAIISSNAAASAGDDMQQMRYADTRAKDRRVDISPLIRARKR